MIAGLHGSRLSGTHVRAMIMTLENNSVRLHHHLCQAMRAEVRKQAGEENTCYQRDNRSPFFSEPAQHFQYRFLIIPGECIQDRAFTGRPFTRALIHQVLQCPPHTLQHFNFFLNIL